MNTFIALALGSPWERGAKSNLAPNNHQWFELGGPHSSGEPKAAHIQQATSLGPQEVCSIPLRCPSHYCYWVFSISSPMWEPLGPLGCLSTQLHLVTTRHQRETMALALPFLRARLSSLGGEDPLSHSGGTWVPFQRLQGATHMQAELHHRCQKRSTTGAMKCCTTGQCVYAVPFHAAVSPQSPAQGWSSSKVSSFALTRTW